MTVLTISQVKTFLRVFHTLDDELLLDLIAAAEAEALQYMDRQDLPRVGEDESPDECDTALVIDVISEGTSLAPDVRAALYYLIQAKYEAANPDDAAKLRKAGETLLAPHRRRLGV
jgi:hypothetical protein